MKKKSVLFLMLFISFTFAQKGEKIINLKNFDNHPYHYGFYLGGNKNTFKIAYTPNEFTDSPEVFVDAKYGFNIGLIGDLRLHNNINLRFEPGLVSNTKTLTFKHVKGEKYKRQRKIGNTYLHVPLLLKFSTNRLVNVRPYVLGGVSYDYNFASNSSNKNDNYSGEFRQEAHVFMYELGLGMEFYLKYFKFSPSIRATFAITNEIIYDNKPSPWTSPIDYMGSRGIFLNFAFE